MVIKTEQVDNIQEFMNKAVELYNYTSSKNMVGNPQYDAKYSVKLGKQIDKIVKAIIDNPDDMAKFIDLLNNENILIAYLASEYLFPVYPQKCIKIMKKFCKTLDDKIDIYTVKTKIEGLEQNRQFFIDTYKKLYKCENLDVFNRERE